MIFKLFKRKKEKGEPLNLPSLYSELFAQSLDNVRLLKASINVNNMRINATAKREREGLEELGERLKRKLEEEEFYVKHYRKLKSALL